MIKPEQNQPDEDSMSTTCSPEHQPDEPTLKRPGPDTRTVTLAPERKRQKLHLSSLWLMLQRPRKIRLPPDDIWFEDHQRWMRKRNYLLLLLNALKYHNGLYSICIVALRQIFESTCQMVEFTELMKTLQTAWTRRRSSNIWPDFEASDKAELKQFVDEKVFGKVLLDDLPQGTALVDATWVRKFKRTGRTANKTLKAKSRLCARGFLDPQKEELPTRSTTATRLSQRLVLSVASTHSFSPS